MELIQGMAETCNEAIGLLMTYRCNLDCKYCYIKTKKKIDMNLETVQNILEQFLNKDDGIVDITFMGGETLLAYDVIVKVVDWVESKEWKRKYRFFGSTNGTLLKEEMKEWLISHKEILTLALSYDGLPSCQIENRGNDDIDLDFFLKTWPHQPIQMTINEDSVGDMAAGVIYLLEKGAKVHPNVAFEENDWSDAHIKEYSKQLYKLGQYYNEHESMPIISQFSHDLTEYADNLDNPKEQKEICGAGHGFQVYDVDGKSYPCHILSPLVLNNNRLKGINNEIVSKIDDFSDTRCKDCPFNTACPTCIGCNYIYRGKLQKRDLTHCLIMQAEVKAYIMKEVLRLEKKRPLTSKEAVEIDAIAKVNNYMNSKKRISLPRNF